MQGQTPGIRSQTTSGQERGPLFCVVGNVRLLAFTQTPVPGTIIGQVDTAVGVGVPLVQTVSTPPGGTTLTTVDKQTATVCGALLFKNGQLALDVAFVSPGSGALTPGMSPLALMVLSLMGLLPVSG